MTGGSKIADLSLNVDIQKQLRQLIIDDRGLGEADTETDLVKAGADKVVLFSGVNTADHAAAAAALGKEKGSPVYLVDTSSLQSKYIAETEKNIDRLFKKAGQSNAILLFEEAEALFGKRTSVGDAHDRYANVEVSYLLAKAAEQGIMVILSVTAKVNIDKPFLRRLRYVVEF